MAENLSESAFIRLPNTKRIGNREFGIAPTVGHFEVL